jgi:hypothetical protein
MKTHIYCKPTNTGMHSFYLVTDGREYYLFAQDYRRGVQQHFGNGILIDDAYDYSKAKRDSAVIRTLSKLPSYIRYVENEYGIIVLKQTQRRKLVPYRRDRHAA